MLCSGIPGGCQAHSQKGKHLMSTEQNKANDRLIIEGLIKEM